MSQLNFDATTVAPDTGFDPVPAGDYTAMIVDSEIKPTKTGSGMYLQLVWQICDGQFANRRVWDRINIQNQNQMAEEIGRKQLSSICHAVGVLRVIDSAELHERPCSIKVVLKPGEGQYLPSNEVKGYRALDGSAPPPAVGRPAAPPAAPAAAVAAPPWARK